MSRRCLVIPGYDVCGGTTASPGGGKLVQVRTLRFVPAGKAGPVARTARHGLIQVLAGRGAAPPWRSHAQRAIAAALAALGVVLVLVSVAGLAVILYKDPSPHPGTPFTPVINAGDLVTFGSLGILLVAVRYPLLAWRVGYLAALLTPLIPSQPRSEAPTVVVPLLIVFCAAGVLNGRAVTWSMWFLLLLPAWLWAFEWQKTALITLAITGLAAAVDAIGGWRRERQVLMARAEQAELEESRRAVLEERTRIARELHDVVAHHMSLMAVQAETAPYRLSASGLGALPEPARAEFSALSAAARAALTDMRRLLGVLRTDEPVVRTPQPQLGQIKELVDAAKAAGVPVEFAMDCTEAEVPPGVGVCVYRIMQEALSNAIRHAPGAKVTVRLIQHDGAIRLDVANGEASVSPLAPDDQGPGHGLTGMRERAVLLGGTLTAGPAPDGGFAVSALLPLRESS